MDEDLIVKTPQGGESNHRNLELAAELGNWSRADGTGIGLDSSCAPILQTNWQVIRGGAQDQQSLFPRWVILGAVVRVRCLVLRVVVEAEPLQRLVHLACPVRGAEAHVGFESCLQLLACLFDQ